jgi:hypothetical protein
MATMYEKSGQTHIDLKGFLKDVDFPVQKQELLQHLQQIHADREMISQVQRLEDREYENVAEIIKIFGIEPTQQGKHAQTRVQNTQPQMNRR